jgi:site-specific DNA-methyltransferase (adenine-specific)
MDNQIRRNKIYNLDCRKGLKQMVRDEIKVSSVITSPPYYNQRVYKIKKNLEWKDGWIGQLGLEPTFDQFVEHLCDIFDLVKKVLREDGVIFVNMGDCYSSREKLNKNMKNDIPDNCFLLTPQRFAIEMVERDWILRNVIIWKKKDAIPSSIKNRFTPNFEYIYFFAKNKEYYFKQQYEPYRTERFRIKKGQKMAAIGGRKHTNGNKNPTYSGNITKSTTKGRYKRTTWDVRDSFMNVFSKLSPQLQNAIKKEIVERKEKDGDVGSIWETNTSRSNDSHFAVYPKNLIKTPILAGTPKYICNKCNKPMNTKKGHKCNKGFKSGIVLDIFAGLGTTLIEALELGRDCIGFEVSKEYYNIAKKKLKEKRFQRLDKFIN